MYKWMNKLLLWIHNIIIQRKLQGLHYERRFVNYNALKNVLILFSSADSEDLKSLNQFVHQLKADGKKVEVLVYSPKQDKSPHILFDAMTDKEVNIFKMPHEELASKYISNQPDLLLNLYAYDCLPLEYISALSQAHFRIGRYLPERIYCYDLMLEMEKGKNVSFLIEQAGHYLKMLNTHVKTA